jgi:ribonuclease HII
MPRTRADEQQDDRAARLWAIEQTWLERGIRFIAGVDEAGRGPLAGPLVVAAVILPPGYFPAQLNDSKQLTAAVRERLYDDICANNISHSIQVIPVEDIDTYNILRATHRGMRAAISSLDPLPQIALVDGLPLPDTPVPQESVIDGDARSASIAAASILAKVTRDRLMLAFDTEYPGYGFAQHKGYATAEHREALRRLGPCPLHRRSFAPVRACCEMQQQLDL